MTSKAHSPAHDLPPGLVEAPTKQRGGFGLSALGYLRFPKGLPMQRLKDQAAFRLKLLILRPRLFLFDRYGAFFAWPKNAERAGLSLKLLPVDPWEGHRSSGEDILRDVITLSGQTLVSPSPLWHPQAPPAWLEDWHGFTWLLDLKSLGTDQSRQLMRARIRNWIACESGWNRLVWDPVVSATRLSNWLKSYDFFASSADVEFRALFLKSCSRHVDYLMAVYPAPYWGAARIRYAKALILSGLVMVNRDPVLEKGLRLLLGEIDRQILGDGCHISRNPSHHMAVLQDCIEIRANLRASGQNVPSEIQDTIDTMAPALKFFLHADGMPAFFNGASSIAATKPQKVLQMSNNRRRPLQSLHAGGFTRLQAGKTLILVDSGPPPPPGFADQAHAGLFSFEMSVAKERVIVNCGALDPSLFFKSRKASHLHTCLRSTPAHSTLSIDNQSTSPLGAACLWHTPGFESRPNTVRAQHQHQDGDVWLDMTHDGYRTRFGALHHRRIFVRGDGLDIRGEDRLDVMRENDAPSNGRFSIRFHLHPDVQASLLQNGTAVLLKLAKGGGWTFRTRGAKVSLEDSIYMSGHLSRRTQQIRLYGDYTLGDTLIQWALQKEGAK